MSRIHEALKKAEQERAATQGGVAQPSFATTPVVERPQVVESCRWRQLWQLSGMPAFASPFSLDTLLARCPQMEWKPDLGSHAFHERRRQCAGHGGIPHAAFASVSMREKMTLKTVLVTSALPREGKSFTSANLAQVMVRQHGRRVLLIDADLRGPRLHLMLGTTAGPGLSDYLQGRNDEFSIMQRGALENLFFIPSGTGIEDPAELVGNGRLKVLLQRSGAAV